MRTRDMVANFNRVLLSFVIVFAGILPFVQPPKANALAASDFKAGRIIDDIVFFNPAGFSVAEIQNFLNAKVPTCDTNGNQAYGGTTAGAYGTSRGYPPPYTCLKDYRQNTVAKSAETGLCSGYPAASQSAAEMIYGVAQSCGINPKVLIVLLQKEQGLVTDDWPWSIQYRSATGYGCPDTAACDAEYYGFFNQVYSAARQFKRYSKDASLFNYRAARNNYIQYNPDANCGGTTVYIETQATAGLYNYTPYQPKPEALIGMSDSSAGTTVNCGAYGNRNFFWYYSKWFGSTLRSLITTIGEGVYQVENGLRRGFPNEITFLSYGNRWPDILSITNAEYNQIPTGTDMPYNVHFRDGILVRPPSGGVYVVDNGTKRPFANEGTFFSYGYKYTDALIVTAVEINLIPDGAALSYNVHLRDGFLVQSPSGGMYVVDNGTKRPFANEGTFFSYGYTYPDALVISGAEISLIPDGAVMPYKVHFRDGRLVTSPSKGIYRVENGTKRAFPNEITFLSNLYRWSDVLSVSSTELNLIPDGAVMPYNVHYRNGHLVTSTSGGVYVVENGLKRPFPNEGTFFSYGYKYTDALVISTSELNLIPIGAAMPPKS